MSDSPLAATTAAATTAVAAPASAAARHLLPGAVPAVLALPLLACVSTDVVREAVGAERPSSAPLASPLSDGAHEGQDEDDAGAHHGEGGWSDQVEPAPNAR